MPEFEYSESTHSLDREFGGLDVPIMRTLGAKKVFTKTSEQLRRSTRDKNVVRQFGHNDYMAYHYAFIMKVATPWEPMISPKLLRTHDGSKR